MSVTERVDIFLTIYTKRKTEETVDIGVYDVQKCFDTLWVNEALNDAYKLGLNNNQLPLVYMSNKMPVLP